MYIFIKLFFKTNLYNFHICKLNNLKIIDDLYSQYLIQILSKIIFNFYTKRVYVWLLFLFLISSVCP